MLFGCWGTDPNGRERDQVSRCCSNVESRLTITQQAQVRSWSHADPLCVVRSAPPPPRLVSSRHFIHLYRPVVHPLPCGCYTCTARVDKGETHPDFLPQFPPFQRRSSAEDHPGCDEECRGTMVRSATRHESDLTRCSILELQEPRIESLGELFAVLPLVFLVTPFTRPSLCEHVRGVLC